MSQYKKRFVHFARFLSISLATGTVAHLSWASIAIAQQPRDINNSAPHQATPTKVAEPRSTILIDGKTYSADVLKCPICRERLGFAPLPPGAEVILNGHENEEPVVAPKNESVPAKPPNNQPLNYQSQNFGESSSAKPGIGSPQKSELEQGTPNVPHQATLTPLAMEAMESAVTERSGRGSRVASKVSDFEKKGDSSSASVSDADSIAAGGFSDLKKTLSELPKPMNLDGIPPKVRQALLDDIDLPEGGRILSYNIVDSDSGSEKNVSDEPSSAPVESESITSIPTKNDEIETSDVEETKTETELPLNVPALESSSDSGTVENEEIENDAVDSVVIPPDVTRSLDEKDTQPNIELMKQREQNETRRNQLSAMKTKIQAADRDKLAEIRGELTRIQTGLVKDQSALLQAQSQYWHDQLGVSIQILDVMKENHELQIELLDSVKSIDERLADYRETTHEMSNAITKLEEQNRVLLEKLERYKEQIEKSTKQQLKKQSIEQKNRISKIEQLRSSEFDALQQKFNQAESRLDEQSERRKKLEEQLRRIRQQNRKKKKNQ